MVRDQNFNLRWPVLLFIAAVYASRASRTVWIAVRCPGINDAIARPADSAIVGPKSYHRRCVDAVGQLIRARGGGEERCWGAADAAVDCAGALLAVGFPVLSRVARLITIWLCSWGNLLGDWIGHRQGFETTEGQSGEKGKAGHGELSKAELETSEVNPGPGCER